MRNMTLLVTFMILTLFTLPFPAAAKEYRYMSAQEVKERLEQHAPMTLVDIQVEEEFGQHHIAGAVATYAYPVKTDDDRKKMSTAISDLLANNNQAIVVCPRGGGGAERAYDLLLNSGINEERVYILTGGQAKWPYPELLAK